MTDRDFLELFNKIDDKFLEEAQHDQRKYRIGKRRILNMLSTTAACLAVVISAVLLVSSFVDSGLIRLPDNGSDVRPEINISGGAASAPTSDSSVTSPSDRTLSFNSRLNFTTHSVETLLVNEANYAAFGAVEDCTVSAEFEFSASFSDGSLDTDIPVRMYVFADGQPISFEYRHNESAIREFTIEPEKKYSLPISFKASADVNTISIVCIFFPGDAELQDCLIWEAGNVYGTKEIFEYIPDEYIEYTDSVERGGNFITLSGDRNIVPVYTGKVKNAVIPSDSAYLFVSLTTYDYDDEIQDLSPSAHDMHYIIVLVNGRPVNVPDNGEPFCLGGDPLKKEVYYRCKIPEECLSENSTLQVIALPAAVESWHDYAFSSSCYLIK